MLKDVDIPEASWKADFDVVERYQSFANEMMRISLLGIAGYGFLIKEICMKDRQFYSMLQVLKSSFGIGAICFLVTLIFSLAHRFTSTACLYYQVQIMRGLKRLENPHWSDEEKKDELLFIENCRKRQREISNTSHYILITASVDLFLDFYLLLFRFTIFSTKSQFDGVQKICINN